MSQFKALIVDDEEINRETLAKMIDQFFPDIYLTGKAPSIQAARELIESQQPDMVFLDIEMPQESGFELFTYYPAPRFSVIFTTGHTGYALKAIKFAALDYLLKPININELKNAVNKAMLALEKNSLHERFASSQLNVLKKNTESNSFNKIAIPTTDGMDFYDVNDILRCEAERSYCYFYLSGNRKIFASKSMKEFEEMLTDCGFFRVHKSDMVNLRHIRKYFKGKGGYVILSDDSQVEVSIRKKDELLQVLTQKQVNLE